MQCVFPLGEQGLDVADTSKLRELARHAFDEEVKSSRMDKALWEASANLRRGAVVEINAHWGALHARA